MFRSTLSIISPTCVVIVSVHYALAVMRTTIERTHHVRYVPLNPTVHRVFQIYTHDISVTTLQTVHFFNVLRLIGGGVVARTSQID